MAVSDESVIELLEIELVLDLTAEQLSVMKEAVGAVSARGDHLLVPVSVPVDGSWDQIGGLDLSITAGRGSVTVVVPVAKND